MSDLFDDLEDFGAFDDVVSGNVRDPYPELARQRHETPIQRIDMSAMPGEEGKPVFIVYRHEDIQTMLRDNETFSSNVVIQIFGDVLGHGVMLGMDEPVHGRLRSLVTKAFTQKALARWEDEIVGRIGNELIDQFAANGKADLAKAFTFPFPTRIIAALLGLPEEDFPQFQRWSISMLSFTVNPERGKAASQALVDYFSPILKARRAEPREDLISSLAAAEIDGEKLADEDIYSFIRLLLPAGVETTYRSLGNLLFALLTNEDQLEADPRRPVALTAGDRRGRAMGRAAVEHHQGRDARHRACRSADSARLVGDADARRGQPTGGQVSGPGPVRHLPAGQGPHQLGTRGARLSRHAPGATRDAHRGQPSTRPAAQPAAGSGWRRSAHPWHGVPLADVATGALRSAEQECVLTDFESIDFFTDEALVPDPYPYFDHLRSKCPVTQATPFNVLAVTGYEEALAVYKDPAFSSCISVAGPFSGLPFGPGGDDVSELIEEHRGAVPMSEHITTQDPPLHTRTRGLLNKLITPKRLKENEDFMWRLADEQLDTFVDRGSCEFLEDYAKPFSLLVIADLLGVPAEDHDEFRAVFAGELVGQLGEEAPTAHNPLQWLNDKFHSYIENRRREPRGDVLTELAQAKYEDGSTPDIDDVMNLSTFLFAAGTETTTKLVSSAMRVIAENPEYETYLREDRGRIPAFLEETLRMESPVKSHFRMARTSTTIGDTEIPAGSTVMLLPGACNRDARKFNEPDTFRPDRRNVREQIAFIRGVHSCPGAPLARTEGRISVSRILDRMTDFRVSEEHHGPPEARRYAYEPTFIMRGLAELHLEFKPNP